MASLLNMVDPAQDAGQADEDGESPVHVHDAQGILIGDNGRQSNYFTYVGPRDSGSPERYARAAFTGEVESPYRGLMAFWERDAPFFFGQDAAADEVLGRLRALAGAPALPDAPAFLVVSGVSGAGKSSLLRAGVLPRIGEITPDGTSWPRLVLTPARSPLSELAAHAARRTGKDAATLRQALREDPAAFALAALEAAGTAGDGGARGRLLVVVDQFEQVFTQCGDDRERRAFIAALHAAAAIGHGWPEVPAAVVVLVVRADFEARCADYEELVRAVQDRYFLPPMTGQQLRLAITEPARVAGSPVDDALVGKLVETVRAAPSPGAAGAAAGGTGALPHLSHALDKAWRNRAGDRLTLDDFERAGGIEGSIGASADSAYALLTPAQREAARQVFLRLVATSANGTDTGDRAGVAELTEGKSPAGIADVQAVLEAFAAQRLLTLTADSVELSHEVLLTAWPLLRDTWLAETHADRFVRTRLRNTAAEWEGEEWDSSYLYSGILLQTATETAARDPAHYPPLSRVERDFLHASNRARRRTEHRRRAVIAGLLALTLAALTAAGMAVRNAASTSRQHAAALSRLLAAESLSIDPADPVTARRLAVAAWSVYHTDQASSALSALLTEQRQLGVLPAATVPVNAVAFSPDSTLLAAADDTGTVRLWNPVTGHPAGAPFHTGTSTNGHASGVAFSPDGKLLATADSDGTFQLWHTATGTPATRPIHAGTSTNGSSNGDVYIGVYGGVYGVAFSPDGKLLATADSDGTFQLWHTATGTPATRPIHAGTSTNTSVNWVAFSRDGKLLATADSDGTFQSWHTATGTPATRPIHAGTSTNGSVNGLANVGVSGVAFNPDGKLLATADSDGTFQFWHTATGTPDTPPRMVDANGLNGVAFSPDGKLLATAASFGGVRLWHSSTGTPAADNRYTGFSANSGVEGVAFSPDGKLLAAADNDGSVQLLNPATGHPPAAPLSLGTSSDVWGLAFSRDSKLLATADSDGTFQLWHTATGTPATRPIHAGTSTNTSVNGVAFSPDGKLLATADSDGTFQLWHTATGTPVSQPRVIGKSATGFQVIRVVFSPDGKLLATSGNDGTIRLWHTATGTPGAPPLRISVNYRTQNPVWGLAFSPDGKLLATADNIGTIQLWHTATGKPAGAPFYLSKGTISKTVLWLAFSPDGKLLATADNDGTIQLWHTAIGTPDTPPLQAGTSTNNNVTGVAFSPDGKLLATNDNDGTIQLWNPVTGQPASTPLYLDTSTGANAAYGVAFSPDGKLLAAAHSDRTIQLWKVPLFTNPYTGLCADVGSPTQGEWAQYASSEPLPGACT